MRVCERKGKSRDTSKRWGRGKQTGSSMGESSKRKVSQGEETVKGKRVRESEKWTAFGQESEMEKRMG